MEVDFRQYIDRLRGIYDLYDSAEAAEIEPGIPLRATTIEDETCEKRDECPVPDESSPSISGTEYGKSFKQRLVNILFPGLRD
jgi:hypothetical protein